ncbi:GntR family transcriptional regulator [Streptomyces roseolilacinus]|uniref:GntR family transcriptional regulator n=1 Tax=Streptomyces roseolilacinus TaxID=66904 RepID=UPI0037FD22F3
MPVSTEAAPDLIAGDLAVAIHQGSIRGGERLPSQSQLARSYGVSSGTAAAALGKLAAAGLIRTIRGAGTYAIARPASGEPHPVMDVLAAASLCRDLASITVGAAKPGPPTLDVGGDPAWGTEHERPSTLPPRRVDVGALAALDRHVLRWMSEAYVSAARRLVARGVTDADRHLITSARALLRDGGRRPEDQEPIAHFGGPVPVDEDVVLRIWPERAEPTAPDGPPF